MYTSEITYTITDPQLANNGERIKINEYYDMVKITIESDIKADRSFDIPCNILTDFIDIFNEIKKTNHDRI